MIISPARTPHRTSLAPRSILTLLVVALLLAYCATAVQVLNRRVERQRDVTGHAFAISDLFPRWYGAQAMLAGVSPYSETFRADLHREYYGEPKTREWERDTFRNICEFFYPPFVLLPLVPLLWLPFEVVRWLATAAIAGPIGAGVLLWLRHAGITLSRPRAAGVAALAVVFYPSLDAILLQQLTGLVFLYVIAAVFLAGRNRHAAAGALLALAMIKPQSALIPAACLLFWALWQRDRRPMLLSFAAVMAAQLALAEWLVPGWIFEFIAANARYREYNTIGFWLPGQLLGSDPLGAVLIAAPLVALLAWGWWRVRALPLSAAPAVRVVALTFVAGVILMPDISYYNKIFLLPAVAFVVRHAEVTGVSARLGRRLLLLALGVPVLLFPLATAVSRLATEPASPAAEALGTAAEAWFLLLPIIVLLVWCGSGSQNVRWLPRVRRTKSGAQRSSLGDAAGAGLLFALWGMIILRLSMQFGLFRWIGVDFGLFWAAARLFFSAGPAAAYDLVALGETLQFLRHFYGPLGGDLIVGPTPYPPPFLALVYVFSLVPPALGFALWTLMNVLLAASVLRDLTTERVSRPTLVACVTFTFFPLGYAILVGQPTVILLYAFHQSIKALRSGADLRAGLWAGILLLKPQYALFYIAVLAWKRRWRTLAGVGGTALVVASSSVGMLGTEGIAAFIRMASYAAGFRSVDPIALPDQMISWRGLLVNLLPSTASEPFGLAATAALTALSTMSLIVVWRGPWNPHNERFPAKLLAIGTATMLGAFHNHIHGAALLAVPGLLAYASPAVTPSERRALRLSSVVPLAVFSVSQSMSATAIALSVVLVAWHGYLFWREGVSTDSIAIAIPPATRKLLLGAAALLGCWIAVFIGAWRETGLFKWIGYDYASQ